MVLKNNFQKGRYGENIAKEYLISQGCKIIECNWHYSKNAEIDIIAEDKGVLIFVEVKTRTSLNFGHPFESIDYNKLRKIHTAILGYLSRNQKHYNSYRIDGIAVIGLQNPSVEHIKNIGQY